MRPLRPLAALLLLTTTAHSDSFGSALLLTPDLTGDGTPNLLVADATGAADAHAAAVCDLRTGAILHRVGAGYCAASSPRSLAWTSDRNGDGIPELLLTAHRKHERPEPGLLLVSGADGSALEFFSLPDASSATFGIADVFRSPTGETLVAVRCWRRGWLVSLLHGTVHPLPVDRLPLGDLDSRGRCDHLRVDPGYLDARIQRFEKGTREPVWTYLAEDPRPVVFPGADFNADGTRDLVLLLRPPTDGTWDELEGRLVLLDGRHGCELQRVRLETCWETYVLRAQVVGDLDGDDVQDVVVNAWTVYGCGTVRTVSSRTGEVLSSFEQDDFPPIVWGGGSWGRGHNLFGTSFVAAHDADGDDRLDVWLGTGYWKQAPNPAGIALYSSATGRRLAETHRPR